MYHVACLCCNSGFGYKFDRCCVSSGFFLLVLCVFVVIFTLRWSFWLVSLVSDFGGFLSEPGGEQE